MIKGIYQSALGAIPKTYQLDVLANNVANIETIGFKKDHVFFRMVTDAAAQIARGQSEPLPAEGIRMVDFSDGSLRQTGNPLDLALQGNGLFVVETREGLRFTRDGSFTLGQDGTILTRQGFRVMGVDGPLRIPDVYLHSAASLSVNERGELMAGSTRLGILRIAKIDHPAQFMKAGANNFMAGAGVTIQEAAPGEVLVRQGFLEESNVDGIEEMIRMIELNRQFESEQKSIQQQDATLEKAMEVGKL